MIAKPDLKSKVVRIFKLLVLLSLFTCIIKAINWTSAVTVLKQADYRWIALACLGSFLGFIPMAKRYTYLLQASSIDYSIIKSYKAYLAGTFVGLAMTGVIGTDATRIWYCNRDSSASLVLASALVFTERLLGLGSLIILMNCAIQYLDLISFDQSKNLLLFISILAVVIITLIPVLFRYFVSIKLSSTYKLINFVYTKFNYLGEKLYQLKALKISHLCVVLSLSLLAQFIDILVTYFLAKGLGFNVPFLVIMLIIPLSYLVTMLPISPAGLGLREGVFIVILPWFNVPADQAALLALSVFFMRVLIGLVGGINILAMEGQNTRFEIGT